MVGQTDTGSLMVGWYEAQFKCPLKIPVHWTLTIFASTPSICCHSMWIVEAYLQNIPPYQSKSKVQIPKYKFQNRIPKSQILRCKFHQSTGLCPCVEARLPKWWFGGGGRPTVAIRSPHHYNPEPWVLCKICWISWWHSVTFLSFWFIGMPIFGIRSPPNLKPDR